MAAHTQAEFDKFMSTLQKTNRTLNYYFCDFDKIKSNVELVKMNLSLLDCLLKTTDIKASIQTIFQEYGDKPFKVLPLLIATRLEKGEFWVVNQFPFGEAYDLNVLLSTPNGIYKFLQDTTLLTLFQDKSITSLVDYVFGIETGLDSNARKNRSGEITEKAIADIFTKQGVKFDTQVKSKLYPQLNSALGKDMKKFDFVIKTKKKTYVIEVNFYNGGGSKPNEVARAYAGISPKINAIQGYEFVWITDGIGWFDAKPEIKNAFDIIPKIYNMTSLQDFIAIVKQEKQDELLF